MVRSSPLSRMYVILSLACECQANYDFIVLLDTFLSHSLWISLVCQIVCRLSLSVLNICWTCCGPGCDSWNYYAYLSLLFTSGCMWICWMTEHYVLNISGGWLILTAAKWLFDHSYHLISWVNGSQWVCGFIVYPCVVTLPISRLHKIKIKRHLG
jgi:hypothetical protein